MSADSISLHISAEELPLGALDFGGKNCPAALYDLHEKLSPTDALKWVEELRARENGTSGEASWWSVDAIWEWGGDDEDSYITSSPSPDDYAAILRQLVALPPESIVTIAAG